MSPQGDIDGLRSYACLMEPRILGDVPATTMYPFAFFWSFAIDDLLIPILTFVNVVLTIVIAFSARSQARSTRQLAEISIRTERRVREYDEPKVKLDQATACVIDGSRLKSFVGFSITNASRFDVFISTFRLGLGIPVNAKPGSFVPYYPLPPAKECQGSTLSDCSPSRRLQPGESTRVLYDEDRAVEALKSEEGKPVRVRPECYDSLGNHYTLGCWIAWGKNSRTEFKDPGPGMISEEQWKEWLARTQPRKKSIRESLKLLLGRGAMAMIP